MAASKPKKQKQGSNGGGEQVANQPAASQAKETAATPQSSKTKATRVGRRAKVKVMKGSRKPGRPRTPAGARKTPKRSTPKATRIRRGRKRYSDAERRNILDTARREGLTGKQVQERFGVTQVTYYLWKKKSRMAGSPTDRAGAVVGRTLGKAVNLAEMIRHEIRANIGRLLPDILKSEIGGAVSGSATHRGRRRG